jgi:hypothetical protein
MTIKYIFKCPKCMEYKVSETAFKKFVTPEQWEKLQKRTKEGVCAGMIEFDKKCPQCVRGKFVLTSTIKALKVRDLD